MPNWQQGGAHNGVAAAHKITKHSRATTAEGGRTRMTIAEIKAFLKENAEKEEVKAFLAEQEKPITAESAGKWLETEEGKKLIQPLMDKRVTEALKTYREGHYGEEVKKAVADEIQRINPKETPEQKQIRELVDKDRKRDAELAKERLDRQALEVLTSEGLPSWYVDILPGNTIEEKKTAIAKIKAEQSERETKIRNEILGKGFKPGSGNGGVGSATKPEASKLTLEQAIELETRGELNAALQK
jgi:hypothetical protein